MATTDCETDILISMQRRSHWRVSKLFVKSVKTNQVKWVMSK